MKGQYPLTRMLYDFKDMQANLDTTTETYGVVLLRDLGCLKEGTPFTGRFARSQTTVITTLIELRAWDSNAFDGAFTGGEAHRRR